MEITAGRVTVETAFADRLSLAFERVVRVRFSSGLFTYLSDLDPVEEKQTPYIGGSDDFLFPWRRDVTVTGEPLVVAGRTFGKGLGMHSRSSLTYALDGDYSRFTSFVGVADEVLAHAVSGSLVVRVTVDGEERFQSPPLRPGEEAVPVDVDVSGGARLTLTVDFGDRGDLGDRAVVGDAMLLSGD